MSRFADAFVAVCIVVIAVSAGMVTWLQSGQGAFAGVSVTLALLLVLLLLQAHSNRLRDRQLMERQIDDLARRTSHALGELSSIERRLAAIESGRVSIKVDDSHLVSELEQISTIVTQMAETVGAFDHRLGRVEREVDRPAALEAAFRLAAATPREMEAATALVPAVGPRDRMVAMEPPRRAPIAATPKPRPLVPPRYQALGEAGFIDLLKRSLEAQRLEIHLQPLVSLPSRKPVGYDVIGRLRDDDGATILPADYWRAAERSRLIQAIDTSVVASAFRVARRLTQRTKDLMLLVPLSTETLAGPRAFAAIERLAKANVDLNSCMVFGFPLQSALSIGPMEAQNLDSLRSLGFRLSLDQAGDLGFDARLAASRGFRMVRAEVGVVLGAQTPLGSDIHPADMPDLLQRAGLDLIVGDVANEPQVLELLDHKVRLAVGDVFGPARPVRADVLS
jgi:cyclic-di-GMP phosphodiesterase TipF (flagellum assembly factor)